MASHANISALDSQTPILAQAKLAIISASSNSYYNTNPTIGALSEKLNSALKFSSSGQDFGKFEYDKNIKHIEDDNVISKQNASNQMRQAAVMAAAASQQKVRLSAKERLALTAKRPTTNQQISPKQTTTNNHPSLQHNNSSKSAGSLPTLETLLAVQRQLQQHTKQNLNPVPQQVVKSNSNINVNNTQSDFGYENKPVQRNKPLPPSPSKSPLFNQQRTNYSTSHFDSYEKDLPPLPSSISPSTSTDESQMNSLESHQSSPATSLVSIPPPPPPISSYLEQYDEVNCQQTNRSNVSSPSSASNISEISSVKHFPTLQVKASNMVNHTQNHNSSLSSGKKNFTQNDYGNIPPPNLIERPFKPTSQDLDNTQLTSNVNNIPQHRAKQIENSFNEDSRSPSNYPQANYINAPQVVTQKPNVEQCSTIPQFHSILPPPLPSTVKPQATSNQNFMQSSYKSQISYQNHMFNMQTALSNDQRVPNPHPPPPLLPASLSLASGIGSSNDEGFDQPDSGSFRFPTPPPPDLLLDGEENEDDDFQCKIPTPPLSKSMSSVSFPSLDGQQQKQHHLHHLHFQQQHNSSPIFSSSTFSPSSEVGVAANNNVVLQPPPLFRQTSTQQTQLPPPPPQLTVHINNDAGLLSTAVSDHQSANHHHRIMLAMTASSSSPSSSSDGDGQSSNSSSSTSGIHSSIDSPSSSNSKLDDFNYGSKLKQKLDSSTASESYLKSVTSIHPISSVTATNSTSPITAAAAATLRRPALKQKKTVSFSDKVELVACAGEQSDDHLPNPLLARVLAGKLQ